MTTTLVPNTILQNRYKIMRLLGEGGMGAVYQAWDLRLAGRAVAVKENFDSSPDAQAQFKIEADMLAVLNHPSLPRVTDHFIEANGHWYLVMDYIEGDDLETLVGRSGKLSEATLMPWIDQVCDALAYLHAHQPPIIHRDIKPGNIRIRSDGRAMLVDFGIAKLYDPTRKTQLGARAVSPGYSPLEQYGKGITDARSDIYSLGATIYFALTGAQPPEATDLATRTVQLLSPRVLNPTLGTPIEQAILKAMDVYADARFQTVDALRQALRAPATLSHTTGSIICPSCGSVNRPVARVCRNCGQALVSNPAPISQPRIVPPQPAPVAPAVKAVPAPKVIPLTPAAKPKPVSAPMPAQPPRISFARYVMTILIIEFLWWIILSMGGRSLLFGSNSILAWAAISLPGTLAYLFLRKPGAAFFANGISLVLIGASSSYIVVNAVAIEIAFALGRYRSRSLWIAIAAPILAFFAVGFLSGYYGDVASAVAGAAIGGFIALVIARIFKQ